jgi:hypothetical protein
VPGITHKATAVDPVPPPSGVINATNWNDSHAIPANGVLVGDTVTDDIAGVVAGGPLRYLRSKSTQTNSYEFAPLRYALSTDYNWEYVAGAQVTGDLSVAGNKTVTLTPVPLGLNASNQDHWLYIANGVGTPEAVKITGGTAVSGSASGTITFTTVNTHSGNWTILSASAGVKEAYHAQLVENPGLPTVKIPAGTHYVYAPIVFSTNVYLTGEASRNSYLAAVTNNFNVLSVIFASGPRVVYINGIGILCIAGAFATNTKAIYIEGGTDGEISDITINSPYVGIEWLGTSGGNVINYRDIWIFGAASVALFLRSTGSGQCAATICNFYADGAGATMLAIFGTIAGITATNLWLQNHATSIYIEATTRNTNEIIISNSILDGPTTVAFQFIGPGYALGGGTNNVRLSNSLIQAIGFGIILQACGRVFINDTTVTCGGSSTPITIDASGDIQVENTRVYAGASSTFSNYVTLQNSCSDVTLNGVVMRGDPGVVKSAGIIMTSHAQTNINILNCDTNATLPISGVSTSGPVKALEGNLWSYTPSIASAATVTLPYFKFFILTGTTGVTAFSTTNFFNGAQYKMLPQGVVTFTAGATIGNTFTTTANVPVDLVVYNGKVYLS